MSNHTPGPWIAEESQGHGVSVSSEPVDISVAWCGTNLMVGMGGVYKITPEEAEANARLIAAAPELLYALKKLINEVVLEISPYNPAMRNAREAVHKAENGN